MPLQKFNFFIDYFSAHVFLKRAVVGLKVRLLFSLNPYNKDPRIIGDYNADYITEK